MATDRYVDLLKQGFMKQPTQRRKAQPKAPRPIVACEGCRDWHRKGKHTQPLEVRRENEKRARAERREIEARRRAAGL